MKNILLIDDNKGDTILFQEELEMYYTEASMEIAHDKESAFSCLKVSSKIFDLIVLDIHLPGKDGLVILEGIKNLPEYSNIPVVIFTSCCSEEEKERAMKLGAEYVYEKPFELEAYHRIIELFINIRVKPF